MTDASTQQVEPMSAEYAERLVRLQTAWWKRALDVQAPYRWNLRRLVPGFTLDVGCGIGRNLEHLRGNGVGVDPNAHSVEVARARGFSAFTPDEFTSSDFAHGTPFDSLLLAHVVEHMTVAEAAALVGDYLRHVRPGGTLILIAPQEVGFASDDTHVEFFCPDTLARLGEGVGCACRQAYSFPFPRAVGKAFIYNESVWVGVKG